MTNTTKLHHVQSVVFTLFFTSLLSSVMGLSLNKSAFATMPFQGTRNPLGAIALTNTAQIEPQLVSQSPQTYRKESGKLPRKITRKVLRDAAKRSGLPFRRLKIEDATPKTFGNPCIFKFGEVCTREFDPIEGWEVTVRVREQLVTYHVDRAGSQIILDPNASLTASTELPENLATEVLQDASTRSGIPVRNLSVQKATSKTFSNPCVFNFGEVCTREFDPIEGWEVVVEIRRQSVTYHVDRAGSQIALDPSAKL